MSGEAKSGYAGYASASSDYSRTVAFREAQGWDERSEVVQPEPFWNETAACIAPWSPFLPSGN